MASWFGGRGMGSAAGGALGGGWGVLVALVVCSFLQLGLAQVTTDPSEVNALRAIKRSFIDPRKNLRSWNRGDPCTPEWSGVTCNKTAVDGYLHIKELHLLNMNLSGSLAPELGQLSHLEILDVMWNNISGTIPKEIGNIKSLLLLLLNGNKLSGSLPAELGNLSNLDRLQIDENNISGPLPKSFVNMSHVKHLHMNNNSISGQVPPEMGRIPKLLHFLLDNNNLSGPLPEFPGSMMLLILQLDNNNFSGSSIPDSYGKMKSLSKVSLRNCSLHGHVPDLSLSPNLTYLDLSWNQLEGPLPTNKLSQNITTIDISSNHLNGSIPSNFSNFPVLQSLLLRNNLLTGSLSSSIWDNMSFGVNESLIVDVRNNNLSTISGVLSPPPQVTIMLQGNQICSTVNQANLTKACDFENVDRLPGSSSNFAGGCPPQSCPKEGFFEYIPAAPVPCYCAAPIRVGYRLKSPGISDFHPYLDSFEKELAHDLALVQYQLYIESYIWEEGPRLRMYLKLFPALLHVFNESEVRRLKETLAGWKIHNRDIFGPYELLNFTLLGPYSKFDLDYPAGSSNGAFVGILLGTIAGAITVSVVVLAVIMKRRIKNKYLPFKRHSLANSGFKIDSLKGFTFEEIAQSTDRFSNSTQVGKGGYGNVYKGILADGTVVAIKRAKEGSLQGSKEFCTEIELLSRLRHRNLVSLVGYCDEESEQMLIYEFMPNGTLHDHLSKRSKRPFDFPMRLHIALGSAKGIHYLHTEADPPIFHRDIKASNILLDSNFNPKVADFGLSRLAPVPDDEGIVHGHISTAVRGTPGYLDPEYFLTHKLTDKSDVYSLGVVFLELLSGRQPISVGRNIVREVRMAHQRGQIFSVVDSRLDSCPPECLVKFADLALRCCDENMDSRPSMCKVVQELEIIRRVTPDPDFTSSGSVIHSSIDSSLPSSGNLFKSLTTSESDTQSGCNSSLFPHG